MAKLEDDLCKEILEIVHRIELSKSKMWMLPGTIYAPYIPMIKFPEPKYKFSRNWYQAEFDPADYSAVDKWCEEQFGPHPKRPDAWSRWWHKFETSILIRDQEDYFNFVIRWGKH